MRHKVSEAWGCYVKMNYGIKADVIFLSVAGALEYKLEPSQNTHVCVRRCEYCGPSVHLNSFLL